MRRLCLLVCAVLLLAGCRHPADRILLFNLPGGAQSLDPQFTTDPAARMILRNIGEGLVVRDENGELKPGAAERWDISGDGTRYRFFLRENARWQNDEPVTAADFVFALRRMFQPDGLSPHARDFDMIAGAADILAGDGDPADLAVYARGETELEIRLAHASPLFLDLLATPAALPCNEAFFESCRGRYGFEKGFVLANGAYQIDGWDNDIIFRLRPHANSAVRAANGGVNIYTRSDIDALDSLLQNNADAAFVPLADAAGLAERGFSVTERQETVWCVVPNRNATYWGNSLLHQGLALGVARDKLELSARLTAFDMLVPPAARLAGEAYRSPATANVTEAPDLDRAKSLFSTGKQAVPGGELPPAVFYVPAEQDLLLAAGNAQQRWQNELSAYVTVRQEPLDAVRRRLATGEFDLLLLPLSPPDPRADSMLEMFRSGNSFGYHNPLYDNLLDEARAAKTIKEAAARYATAEALLLRDAVIIPLFLEKSAFASAGDLTGLPPAAFLEDVVFWRAGGK